MSTLTDDNVLLTLIDKSRFGFSGARSATTPPPAAWLARLDDGDRARAAEIFHEGARFDFVGGRALLRTTLSRLVDDDRPPASWRFDVNRWGRPTLSSEHDGPDVAFSLSHTRGWVGLALVRKPLDVGLDVETLARRTDHDAVADRYFADRELAAFEGLPSTAARRAHFYSLWTLKEAYIKVRGRGLAIRLSTFWYQLDANTGDATLSFAADHDLDDPERFSASLFAVDSAHLASIVVEHPLAETAARGLPEVEVVLAEGDDFTPRPTRLTAVASTGS